MIMFLLQINSFVRHQQWDTTHAQYLVNGCDLTLFRGGYCDCETCMLQSVLSRVLKEYYYEPLSVMVLFHWFITYCIDIIWNYWMIIYLSHFCKTWIIWDDSFNLHTYHSPMELFVDIVWLFASIWLLHTQHFIFVLTFFIVTQVKTGVGLKCFVFRFVIFMKH